MKETGPRFTHHCPNCRFLAHLREGELGTSKDTYWCGSGHHLLYGNGSSGECLVFRYGNEDNRCHRMSLESYRQTTSNLHPYYVEALILAVRRGFVSKLRVAE